MSLPPQGLQPKCEDVSAKWQRLSADTCVENFVDFAVSLSSFTQFLSDKGLSGLHQSSHTLEQRVLPLFDGWGAGAVPFGLNHDLGERVALLCGRSMAYIEEAQQLQTERRTAWEAPENLELPVGKTVWMVHQQTDGWTTLVSQLRLFNIQVLELSHISATPATPEPAIVLVDTLGLQREAVADTIRALRGQFAASTLVGLNFATDFETLNVALGAGCDVCLPQSTPQAAIVAQVVKLCSTEEDAPYRVLVVEDSKTAGAVIQRSLQTAGIVSQAITDPVEVLDAMGKFEPDLVLMDMYMPGCTGVEVTRVIRQHAEFLSTPVVYLSGDADVGLQVDALRLGGDHFLTKPFNPVILNAVVKSKIDRYRALRRTMYQDSLTGLLNHTASKQRLDAAIHQAKTEGTTLCAAMIDIDHFKQVNDGHGHPMGDQVIRSLAWLLKQRLRVTDTVGRYGGEEFLLVIPGLDADRAIHTLDQIRRDFSRFRHTIPGGGFGCTFSGGIVEYRPDASSDSLVKLADLALYDAKRGGRNRIMVAP